VCILIKVREYIKRYNKDIISKIKVVKKAKLLINSQFNITGFIVYIKDKRDA
jgi:hypothetical protein